MRGPMSSLDFERRAAVDWHWGPTNEVRAALEALSEAGVISLARREGNRRYFDLTDRLYPPELLERRPPVREQIRHKLLSRYRGNGLLGDGGESTLWYGTGKGRRSADDPRDAIIRSELREELVAAGELVPVAVDGLRGPRYIVASDRGHLADAVDEVTPRRCPGRGVRRVPRPARPARLGPRPAAQALRLRLRLGGLRAGREAALGLLRAAHPLRRPVRRSLRAAHRADGGTAPDRSRRTGSRASIPRARTASSRRCETRWPRICASAGSGRSTGPRAWAASDDSSASDRKGLDRRSTRCTVRTTSVPDT